MLVAAPSVHPARRERIAANIAKLPELVRRISALVDQSYFRQLTQSPMQGRGPRLRRRWSLGAHHIDFVAGGHHQSSFARLVHAAEPAGEKWLAWHLFIDAVILPDLHCVAAARAWIAIAGDDETLFSIALCPQCAPRPISGYRNTNARRMRAFGRTSNLRKRKLELRWHVAIGWHVAVDFETDADFNQNRGCPSHAVSSFGPREIVEPKEHRTASDDRGRATGSS